jgi:hypothetical protein
MGFCALMHRYRSDAIDFASLDPKNGMANMELALSVAESCFGIDRLFDPEDVVDMEKPDEKIVITYVAMIFRALARFIKSEALVKSIKKVGTGHKGSCWSGLRLSVRVSGCPASLQHCCCRAVWIGSLTCCLVSSRPAPCILASRVVLCMCCCL